ncbi:TIGR04222 domain-containing membrane protein [Streptomyces sp. LX-29]|uniref:TIGR04222 domain-containing membrane protein n=1 Tax=Streptomyces sp. LX-29 TaxID=2900152 RepID=UPI00240D4FD8|nr:TIGR04222 domain-containing membrane protein [Streptomyces sp. LX-29]WFB05625.1 TIGR04222 domain-containing membrane protein [Streptomyces sp. LX-29]
MSFGYFLLLPGYALAVVCAVYGWRAEAHARRAARRTTPAPDLPAVTTAAHWGTRPAAGGASREVLEIAWLQGGAPRTVDTALLTMEQDGLLRVDAQGKVRLTADSLPRTPAERAITDEHAEAGRHAGAVTLGDLRGRLIANQEIAAIGESLVHRGLAHDTAQGTRLRLGHLLLRLCARIYPVLAVLATGVTFMGFARAGEIADAKTMAWYGLTVVVLMCLAGLLCRMVGDTVLPDPVPATALGRDVLHGARRDRSPYATGAAAEAGGGIALALALDGIGALGDQPVCEVLADCGVGTVAGDSSAWWSDAFSGSGGDSGPSETAGSDSWSGGDSGSSGDSGTGA